MSQSLGSFDLDRARAGLAEQVAWARDSNLFARQLERRVRHSSGASFPSSKLTGSPSQDQLTSSVRRAGEVTHDNVSFSRLMELATTGVDAKIQDIEREAFNIQVDDTLAAYKRQLGVAGEDSSVGSLGSGDSSGEKSLGPGERARATE